MAYQENIPLATTKLRISQADILANFVAIKERVDTNHETFDSLNVGKHKFLKFSAYDHDPAGADDQILLQMRPDPVTGLQEIYIKHQMNEVPYSISEKILVPTDADGNDSGFTILPSKIKMQWGRHRCFPRNQTVIPLMTDPARCQFDTVYNVQLSRARGVSGTVAPMRLLNFSPENIIVYSDSTEIEYVSYTVIGV